MVFILDKSFCYFRISGMEERRYDLSAQTHTGELDELLHGLTEEERKSVLETKESVDVLGSENPIRLNEADISSEVIPNHKSNPDLLAMPDVADGLSKLVLP